MTHRGVLSAKTCSQHRYAVNLCTALCVRVCVCVCFWKVFQLSHSFCWLTEDLRSWRQCGHKHWSATGWPADCFLAPSPQINPFSHRLHNCVHFLRRIFHQNSCIVSEGVNSGVCLRPVAPSQESYWIHGCFSPQFHLPEFVHHSQLLPMHPNSGRCPRFLTQKWNFFFFVLFIWSKKKLEISCDVDSNALTVITTQCLSRGVKIHHLNAEAVVKIKVCWC